MSSRFPSPIMPDVWNRVTNLVNTSVDDMKSSLYVLKLMVTWILKCCERR